MKKIEQRYKYYFTKIDFKILKIRNPLYIKELCKYCTLTINYKNLTSYDILIYEFIDTLNYQKTI